MRTVGTKLVPVTAVLPPRRGCQVAFGLTLAGKPLEFEEPDWAVVAIVALADWLEEVSPIALSL